MEEYLINRIAYYEDKEKNLHYNYSDRIMELKKILSYTKIFDLNSVKRLLPDDISAFDEVMRLRKELKEKNQDENIANINGWLMGVNWCKDYILENKKEIDDFLIITSKDNTIEITEETINELFIPKDLNEDWINSPYHDENIRYFWTHENETYFGDEDDGWMPSEQDYINKTHFRCDKLINERNIDLKEFEKLDRRFKLKHIAKNL